MQDNELQHFGVPGMKWGHRKGKYDSYKKNIKKAREEYKRTRRENRTRLGDGIGIKGIAKAKQKEAAIEKAATKLQFARDKYKIAKSKNPERTEERIYVKRMAKTGIRDSILDYESGGKSTKLYKELAVRKGKEYADKIEKKVERKAITTIAVATTVLGAQIAVAAYEAYDAFK